MVVLSRHRAAMFSGHRSAYNPRTSRVLGRVDVPGSPWANQEIWKYLGKSTFLLTFSLFRTDANFRW